MDRVLAEHRAGKPLYDVILTNDNPMEIMQKEGIFAKYDSPAAKDYPDTAINPETGPIYRYAIVGLVYNNSVIKPGDGPHGQKWRVRESKRSLSADTRH